MYVYVGPSSAPRTKLSGPSQIPQKHRQVNVSSYEIMDTVWYRNEYI